MHIAEVSTLITDFLLGFLTTYFAIRLVRAAKASAQLSIKLWGHALLATALAAFAGGISHGFKLILGSLGDAILWKITVYSIGLASLSMLSGTLMAATRPPWRRRFLVLAGLEFVVFAVWMVKQDAFIYVIYDYLPAMVAVLVLQAYSYKRAGDESARWITIGIVVSFVAAGVQMSRMALHEQYFNHNDLYHVIQMGSVYFLYRGALLLRDRK